MHFQDYVSSAEETLEMITEITHQYFAFSYNFVCLEVMGLNAGGDSAFAFANSEILLNTVTVSIQHSTDLSVPTSVTALEKH